MLKCLIFIFVLFFTFTVQAADVSDLQTLLTAGVKAYNHNDYPTALKKWEQGLTLAKELQDQQYISIFIGNLGVVYDNFGQYAKALQYYEQALEIYRDIGDRKGEGADLSNIGTVYQNLGQYAKALQYYEQALVIDRELGDRKDEGVDLSNIGAVYQHLGQYAKALEYCEQALEIARDIGDHQGEGAGLTNIGAVYQHLDQYVKALQYYEQALEIKRDIGDHKGVGNNLANIGVVYRNFGQYAKALQYYEQALEIYRDIGDRKGVGNNLANIGVVYDKLGQYAKALQYCEQALTIRRDIGDRQGEGANLSNIGNIYQHLGQYAKALQYYEQALEIDRDIGDRKGVGNNLANIGVVYDKLGQYAKALQYYEQALEIYRDIGDRKGVGNNLANIGVVYDKLGQYAKALQYYEQALEIYRDISDRTGEGNILNNIAVVHYTQKDYVKAQAIFQQTLLLFTQTGEPENLWRIWGNLHQVTKKLNNPTAAIFYGKQAVNTIQAMRRSVAKLKDKNLHASFLENKKEVYQNLADLLIAQGRLLEAQQVLNMLKQEEYLEFIRRNSRGKPTSTELLLKPFEQTLYAQYQQQRDKLTALASEYETLQNNPRRSPSENARLQQLQTDLGAARQGFMAYLKAVERELGQIRKTTAEAPSEAERAKQRELQTTLRSLSKKLTSLGRDSQELSQKPRKTSGNVALIYYLATKDKLHIILTTHQMAQLAYQVDVSEAELNRTIMQFRAYLTDPKSDPAALRQTAQQLYGWLIQPLRADLDQVNVTVLMTQLYDTLRYIPFAALHEGKRYLAQQFATVLYTPAAASRLKDDPQATWRVAALGAANPPDADPLPAVAQELETIVRRDKQDRDGIMDGVIYLDQAFDRDALQAALTPQYPLLHIASHFRYGLTYDQSKLILGKGEPMTLEEISYLDFAYLDLLTLSACNTAVGDSGNGAEMEGFGVLAQNLGAKGVIAGLWSVNDASTGAFMQQLYQDKVVNLHSKITALQHAQQAFIEANLDESSYPKKYTHPYYWAAFILMGNWL